MNVGNRINARKVVLSYFYQCCFFINLGSQKTFFSDILSVQNIFESQNDDFKQAKEELENKIKKYVNSNIDENLDYFINIFFNKRQKQEIDMDYVFKLWINFVKYYDEVLEQVNKHTQSFSFLEMNTMNQAIFSLWYIERKVLQTPKEILLNELIELSKRYDDMWTPKLVNGIMHNIING